MKKFEFDELPSFLDNLMKINSGVYSVIGRRLGFEKPVPNTEEYIKLCDMGSLAIKLAAWL